MPSHNHDWLDALLILRREVGGVTTILQRVEDIQFISGTPTYIFTRTGVGQGGSLYTVPSFVQDLPKIERIEVFLRIAIEEHCRLYDLGMQQTIRLCEQLGAASSLTPDIRERWRTIDFETPLHLLPLAQFETRPRCPLCKGRVATGAGAWVRREGWDHVNPQLAKGEEINWWKGLTESERHHLQEQGQEIFYRSDVHDECMRYAHTVLAPMLREAKEAEARQATAEVDK